MARFKILSADGSKVRFEGCPKYVGAYLKPSHLEFSQVSSPTPIDWQVGDYVDYYRTGLRYRLFSIPQATKNARKMSYGSAFVYENVQLFSATKELEIALFRDLVPNDNGIHFSTAPDVSTFEDVAGVARRIQACMDDAFPNRWIIAVADVQDNDIRNLMAETREFSVSNGSCLSALEQIYNTWKNIGWSHTYDAYSGKDIITIGATSVRTAGNTTEVFAYGKRQGLSSIKKADANKDGFATRLYVYGSERNIQTRYYNGLSIHNADSVDIRHLMIPPKYWGTTDGLPDARKAYLQASDAIVSKYGLIPRTIYFDGGENEEIYPSIKGMKAIELNALMIESGFGDSEYLPDPTEERIDKAVSASGWGDGSKEDTEEFPDFTMTIQQVGFNIAEQGKLTAEGHATISMVSGACAGREFKVKVFTYDRNDRPVLHLEKFWDDSVGMAYPNNLYPINAGDEFVILDIPMPDFYITYAQEKLYKKGQQMLADYTKVSAFYEPSIDPIMVEEKGARLREGMFMQIKDEDIVDGSNNVDYVLIDTINIDESGILPTYNVTLREQKRSATTFSSLKEMIDDAKYENKAEFKKERRYVERRFRTAQETMEMLQGAIEGFTPGINPLTLQTMSVLVGSQSLQFTFIKSMDSTEKDTPAFAFDPATKIFSVPESVLMHYTIGQNEILVSHDKRTSFAKWEVNAFEGSPMLDAGKAYYLYVFAPFEGKADFFITDKARVFKDEEGYNLLVGIINSEIEGTRDFAPLYGFTEILPGQITTDVIRSADGGTYFDLANNEIGGRIVFKNNDGEDTDLESFANGLDESISKALEAAEEAEKYANDAKEAASSAKERIDNMMADGVFDQSEKRELQTELERIKAEYNEISANASKYSLTSNAAYTNYVSAYEGYKYGLEVILNDLATKESVKVTGFSGLQSTYYEKLPIILDAIVSKAKEIADNAASKADAAARAAQEAATMANAAEEAAKAATDAANAVVGKIDGDSYLTEIEKQSIRSTIAEITECTKALVKENATIGLTFTNGTWYKVQRNSRAEWTDSLGKTHSVSQYSYEGFYSSNMHAANGTTKAKIAVSSLSKDFALKIGYVSDAETAYDFLTISAIGTRVNTSLTTNNLTNENAGGSTYNRQKLYFTKTYSMTETLTESRRYVEVGYKKNASTDVGTDSGYFRIANDHYVDTSGNIHVVELNGSFHRYYLMLMQAGYTTIANQLASKLQSIFTLLNGVDVWEKGTYELPADSTFRADLNTALTDYFVILADCGFNVMESKVNDLAYLTNAMKNGSTIIDGGLVMSSLVAVGDTEYAEETDVDAFMNGSNFCKDTTHGKLIHAMGIPKSVTVSGTEYKDLERRSKAAKTRIYEDGTIISQNAELNEGCTIGGTVKVTANGIEVDNPNAWGKLTISDSQGLLRKDGNLNVQIGGSCSGAGINISNGIPVHAVCYAHGSTEYVCATFATTPGKRAIDIFDGMIGGMRPNTASKSAGATLTNLDHTCFVSSGPIYLPNDPQIGQNYRIIHTSTSSMMIYLGKSDYSSTFKNIGGQTLTASYISSTKIEMIELIYDGSNWWYMTSRND